MTRMLPALLVTLLLAVGESTSQPSPNTFPARLEAYLANVVKPTAEERQRLASGAPITRLLPADASKEVAIFGAIWINAPVQRYVEAVTDIEQFERGGSFKVTKKIGSPPTLGDFDQLRLTDEDIVDLRTCRVGDCEVKLGEQALQRFKTEVNWASPDLRAEADAVMRSVALEYVTGYLEGGDERLAVYRDKSRPRFVAGEFRAMTDQMPELTTYLRPLRRYLLDFPKTSFPGSTSFLYWQEAEFGLKPIIRISHLTIVPGQEGTVVTSKMLYASHYFWTGLELRVLLPDPARGPGFWLATVNRSRSDGLSGFTGQFVRRRARSEVQESTLAAMRTTKRVLEGSR